MNEPQTPDPKSEVRSALAETGNLPVAGERDEMLTKEELAAKLRVTVRCVENWQRNGVLPFFKIAKVVLFHWPDVLAHLKTNFRICRQDSEGSETDEWTR